MFELKYLYVPYTHHYILQFVYFSPTFIRGFLCFQGGFLCMVSIQEWFLIKSGSQWLVKMYHSNKDFLIVFLLISFTYPNRKVYFLNFSKLTSYKIHTLVEKLIQFWLPFSNQTKPLCTLLLKKQRYRKCSGKVCHFFHIIVIPSILVSFLPY